jgi:hypothetical protein
MSVSVSLFSLEVYESKILSCGASSSVKLVILSPMISSCSSKSDSGMFKLARFAGLPPKLIVSVRLRVNIGLAARLGIPAPISEGRCRPSEFLNSGRIVLVHSSACNLKPFLLPSI